LHEVKSLLAHHDGRTSPIVSPMVTLAGAPAEECPDTIGTYRVIRELGRGGMGVVYLALHEENGFKRHVAIKVLKRGMDTAAILQRFALERQVLGVLNHPNVARLYHAGETDQGLPYFVMEYVDGQPIDRFCDTHRLHIGERLTLFRKVCSAVHHAHQHLVVHRDLKPRNILVTSDGEPKLLDFGIAKLINPDLAVAGGGFTTQDQRVMTPEYASPEQVRGDPISTSSDIYALGVLLYEIVSGHRPYHVRNRGDMDRYICEEDPERPSTAVSRVEEFEQLDEDDESGFSTSRITPQDVCRAREDRPQRLRRRLTGDVDNIVMMAMRKEPQRRYESAEQFSADLRRHMEGLPVLARRDTFGYRCRKFVGRNRLGVGAAATIAILLVGGIVGTASGLVAEQKQRIRADRSFDMQQELAYTFLFEFNDAIQRLDGSIPARQLLVTTALDWLDKLRQVAGDDEMNQRYLASAYERVGDIRGGTRNPSLGDTVGAMESYRTAQMMRRELLDGDPDDAQLQHEMSKSLLRVGDILMTTGHLDQGLAVHQEALGFSEKAARTDPKYRRSVGFDLNNIGAVLAKQGRLDEASDYYSRALAIRREGARAEPRNELYQRDLSVALNRAGSVASKTGDLHAALESYREGLEIRDRLLENNPTSGRQRRDVMVQHFFIAEVLLDLDQPDDALRHVEQCLPVVEQRATDNPASARARRDVAMVHDTLVRTQLMRGDADAAL
ncbi:MAG: serine/threonine protein kinase, partial [Planctomycetes bacterium]|nr:serine/threonine protein kinase [Planctomycetota bacterium]